MFGLDAKQPGQSGNDIQLPQFEQAGHDGRNVPGVAHGHKKRLVPEIPAVPLRRLIGVGFLPEDAPAVFGIEQSHPVMFRQVFHHLHAVVEHPRDLQHRGPASQRLGKLLGRDPALREQDDGPDRIAHIRPVQSRRRGRVAGGSADGQHFVPAVHPHQRPQIAVGAGHAPILERGARVLPVVLEGKTRVQRLAQGRRAFHNGRSALAKKKNVLFFQHWRHQFVKTENAAQRPPPRHGARVEQLAP